MKHKYNVAWHKYIKTITNDICFKKSYREWYPGCRSLICFWIYFCTYLSIYSSFIMLVCPATVIDVDQNITEWTHDIPFYFCVIISGHESYNWGTPTQWLTKWLVTFDSQRQNDAYKAMIGSDNNLSPPLGTKTLSEPILAYCSLGP